MKLRPAIRLFRSSGLFACFLFAARGAEPGATMKLPLSHVDSIDRTNMTITVKTASTNLTVSYTAKTRFFINNMPAISKDLEPADHISGTFRNKTNAPPEGKRIDIVKLAPK